MAVHGVMLTRFEKNSAFAHKCHSFVSMRVHQWLPVMLRIGCLTPTVCLQMAACTGGAAAQARSQVAAASDMFRSSRPANMQQSSGVRPQAGQVS